MISDALQKWTFVIIVCLSAVHPQMMPMGYGFGYGGPMMMPAPMPMPMPVPVPVGIPIPYPESTSETTTTQANNEGGDNGMAIAIPMPVPHFVQIAIPGVMPPNCTPNNNPKNEANNKNCPPCPPCSCNPCTPSFFSFCSPCHLECRCKNGKENPIPKEPNPPHSMPGPAFPMPIPMPGPPPVVIVPFPPQYGNQKKPQPHDSDCDSRPTSKSNSCSEESKAKDSCESDQIRRKKKRKRNKKKKRSNYDIYRRNFNLMKRNRGDNGLVEPVLTYRSRNGDIKMRRRLSNDEANVLLGERDPYNMEPHLRARNGETYNNVRYMAGENENRRSRGEPFHRARDGETYNDERSTAGEDENKGSRVVVSSNLGMRSSSSHRRRQDVDMVLNRNSPHILRDGKKELVFKTPENKKISNLSVSFHIGD